MDDGMTHDNMKTEFDISIRHPPSIEIFTAEPMCEFFSQGSYLATKRFFLIPPTILGSKGPSPWQQQTTWNVGRLAAVVRFWMGFDGCQGKQNHERSRDTSPWMSYLEKVLSETLWKNMWGKMCSQEVIF